MKMISQARELAKPIWWVAMIIVIPASPRSRMTARTSPMSSGSKAEVGSSRSITLGSMARARAMETRCFCPPESWAGYLCRCSFRPTRASSMTARSWACSRAIPRTLTIPILTFSRALR